LDELLEEDSKNYHVWDYKLWLSIHFGKEQEQLAWTEVRIFRGDEVQKVIEEQLKATEFKVHSISWANCYSLWSYRFNLTKHIFQQASQGDRSVFEG
jgi:hypothetical protein